MAPVFAKRADEFAALVEGTSTDGRDRHARLLEVVGQLQAVPARAPRPEFLADLRERLMAEADTVLVPDTARHAAATEQRLTVRPTARRTSRDRRLAVGVGSLALLGAAASVTVGAQVALPGDTLYPMKRAIEDVRTELAVGDARTGRLMMSQATERLEETEGLTRRDDVDVRATEDTLNDFTEQAEGAAVLMTSAYTDSGRPETIVALRDFTGDSMDRLEALEPTLPLAAHDELVAAADAVVAIDDDASATCPSCGGAGVVNVPISLTSAGLLPTTPPDPATGKDGQGRTSGQDGGGPKAPPQPLPTITGELPTLLPSLPPAPSGSPAPTRLPTPTATAPLPSTTGLPSVPLPLPTTVTTLLSPLTPLTTLLSPLSPITSLLPPLPSISGLGLGAAAAPADDASPQTAGTLP